MFYWKPSTASTTLYELAASHGATSSCSRNSGVIVLAGGRERRELRAAVPEATHPRPPRSMGDKPTRATIRLSQATLGICSKQRYRTIEAALQTECPMQRKSIRRAERRGEDSISTSFVDSGQGGERKRERERTLQSKGRSCLYATAADESRVNFFVF